MIIGGYRLPYAAWFAGVLLGVVFDLSVALPLALVIAYCTVEEV